MRNYEALQSARNGVAGARCRARDVRAMSCACDARCRARGGQSDKARWGTTGNSGEQRGTMGKGRRYRARIMRARGGAQRVGGGHLMTACAGRARDDVLRAWAGERRGTMGHNGERCGAMGSSRARGEHGARAMMSYARGCEGTMRQHKAA